MTVTHLQQSKDRHLREVMNCLNDLVRWEMVEAAGVEPASENIPHRHLHV